MSQLDYSSLAITLISCINLTVLVLLDNSSTTVMILSFSLVAWMVLVLWMESDREMISEALRYLCNPSHSPWNAPLEHPRRHLSSTERLRR